MPPLPPGFMKPGSPQPSASGAGKPSFPPPLPGGGPKPALPPISGGAPAYPFAQPQGFSAPAAPQHFQRDAAAEESARMREEKDKLEKKIAEMEKVVSQEKEKVLLATLKNQQDEALSSKVESSLKDIQDKLRRDRHEQEVQEERLALKAKVKDLENRLVSERETWMQTLKGQIQERETQSKDVEGHFIYRLQEMERRWLEEKAQWQRSISQKEDEVRSLKSSAEKLREVEDEFRRSSMEKEMQAREISRLRDEVAKIDREKASVEAYIKNIPEREREFGDMRAENASLRAREEKAHNEAKLAEEKFRFEMDKMQKEIGRLQAEIGSLSDRKNAEKDEELRKLQVRYESALQEKERAVAETTGEKVRAQSELVKLKGFVSRVQAINAVLEKERQSLRLEKMQMAQSMAANIEDVKKFKAEMEAAKSSHRREMDALMKRYQAEVQKFRNDHALEVSAGHAQQLADLKSRHQEELLAANRKNQEELACVKAAAAAGLESRLSGLRAEVKKDLEKEYAAEAAGLKAARVRAEEDKIALEAALKRGAEEARGFDEKLARVRKEYEDSKALTAENYKRLETQAASLMAVKAGYEKRLAALEEDRARSGTEFSRLSAEYSLVKGKLDAALAAKPALETERAALSQELKAERENRARLESELMSLKQKDQQLEFQIQSAALAGEKAARAAEEEKAAAAHLAAELEKYRRLSGSFSGRIKLALLKNKDVTQ